MRYSISSVTLALLDLAVGRLDEAVIVDAGVGGQATRSGRCSDLPASRWGTCGRSACSARRAPRSRRGRGADRRGRGRDRRRLCVSSLSGLVWSMNWLSWLLPKKLWITAETVRALTRSTGVSGLSSVAEVHALLDDARHARQAHRELVGQELAHRADATVAEVVDVVDARRCRGTARSSRR